MNQPEEPTEAVPTAALIADRYRLDSLCGRGGTAEVWRATDTQLDRVVALKLVTVPHDESAARAADEARTLARLAHPALVQVYDAGTDNSGRPWVVMEFVDGETLADTIRRGPLRIEDVTALGLAVAEALDHVHAQGLVHRDVKPANVMLRSDGGVKLTDFGIARLVDAARVTSTGLMVGTAAYLAPEQVAGEVVGPASDIYSLGLMLLEAMTGRRQYDGPVVEAAMARLSRGPELPAELPAAWTSLLSAMTARHPDDRPTAAEVAGVLSRMASGESPTTVLSVPTGAMETVAMPAGTTTRAVPLVERGPVAPAKSKLPWIAAAVIGLLVLVVGGIALSQQDQKPDPIPAVEQELPDPLEKDLQDFVDQVDRVGR